MKSLKLFFAGYFIVLILLFLYSFTQIDLGLVFSRSPFLFGVERWFQTIGYFNRPLSTNIYLVLLFLLFAYYGVLLFIVSKNKITKKQLWFCTFVTAAILVFSYNAFSYDLFNYIFDARIVTHYHQNPYTHKALDFPHDHMLAFMHWTHRTYPYGPVWLGITIPISFLGLNLFVINFFLFKLLAGAFYIGTTYFIGKILSITSPKNEKFGVTFFAFNPLVLLEVLVSAHNDIAMMFFAVCSLYLLLKKKVSMSLVLILLSAAVKFVTGILIIPVLIYIAIKKEVTVIPETLFRSFVFFSVLGFMYILGKMEFQPWYFLWVLPFLALLRPNIFVTFLTTGICLGFLLEYAPFLYQGNWNGNFITIKSYVTTVTPLVFLIAAFIFSRFSNKYAKK